MMPMPECEKAKRRQLVLDKLSRQRAFDEQHGRCYFCKYYMTPTHPLLPTSVTLEHLYPRSRGGPHAPWNEVAACRDCNNTKDDRTEVEFIEHLKEMFFVS